MSDHAVGFEERGFVRVCRRRWLRVGVAAALLLQVSARARADETPKPKASEAEMIEQLLVEVQQLRSRVSDLEAKLGNAHEAETSRVSAPIAGASAAGAPAPGSAAAPNAKPADAKPERSQDTFTPTGLKLRMFGDSGFHTTNLHGDTNTFYVGSLDLFTTGNLSERTSVLGEILFTSGADNTIAPDVERLLLTYKQNDYFSFGIGRYHTSIGYYNPTFHRGAWFQTAIGRPFMYAFDDDGGTFPLQEVGATVSGHVPATEKLGLQYVAEIGNGRDHLIDAEPAQNRQDVNNGKSFNFALSAHPAAVSGLDIGFSLYHDYITFSDNINHSEMISTVHVVYNSSLYEFLNEAAIIRHVGTSDGAPGRFHTPAFYTQFSRKFGHYRPYFRYQYINAGVDEPIYGDPEDGIVVGRRNGPSLGLRWDFNDYAAWKIQYDYLTRRGTDLVSDRTVRSASGIATEFSFAF